MKNIFDMTESEMELFFRELGEKTFRSRQVTGWIYSGAGSFDDMTDLPLSLREKLKEEAVLGTLTVADKKVSAKDGTKKFLLETPDGCGIETVFMKYKYGNTLCVSSQVGCRMGCSFCGSTLNGLERNLTAGEMVEQILVVQRETGQRIGHIVVMGMGEPLDNMEELFRFIRIIHNKNGLNLSLRNITVSTCGLIPGMRALRKEFPQVNLAVSLHAGSSRVRGAMMPIERKYPMDQVLAECKVHAEETGRRVTFEYALVRGVNDSDEHISRLAEKLRGIHAHVNLIPLNPVEETGLEGSSRKRGEEIARYLVGRGISTTLRRELGSDIQGACGQLRNKKMSEKCRDNQLRRDIL
ncbi:MAG: 23S rRNA (adenine(2503)-C(2))-methyltransferase RlmN [Anaerovoracaceae bacterium]|jgi:23S rRNA (adenine2503-C2)-methyltransferase